MILRCDAFRCAQRILRLLPILLLCSSPGALAQQLELDIQVSEPYMELRTGPGRAYHVDYVAERGETVTILKRRTTWFQVRTARRHVGWVGLEDIRKAVMADGVSQELREAVLADFERQKVDVGFAVGRFDGDPIVSFHTGYHFFESLVLDLDLSQVAGTYSGSQLVMVSGLIEHPVAERFVPWFGLGLGYFRNRNRASLIGDTDTKSSTMLGAGLGLKYYLTRNFLLRVDYRQDLSLTSSRHNDRFDQYQVGFSFFF